MVGGWRRGGCCGAIRGVGAGGTRWRGSVGVGIVERGKGVKRRLAEVECKCRLTCMWLAGSERGMLSEERR